MGLVSQLLTPNLQARSSLDDWWFGPVASFGSASGINITPETALSISAVFACVKVLTETIGSLPLLTYETLPNGGKKRARNHPLYEVLHDSPNPWQTSMEWREMIVGHMALRGHSYNLLRDGRRGPFDQVIPLHPDDITRERLEGGRIRYRHRPPGGGEEVFTQEEILHLVGPLGGVSVVSLATETFGLAKHAERFATQFYNRNASPGGVLEYPNTLKKAELNRVARSWKDAHEGSDKAFGVAILEGGMKWHQVGIAAKDAQILEGRQFSVTDIARWFRMPPHKIQDMAGATFSNIEHQDLEFLTNTITPWLVRLEQRFKKDLILARGRYFVEFLVDGMLRGDSAARSAYYSSGINAGWLMRNEARARENLNPIDGLDVPLAPLNLAPPSDSNGRPPEALAMAGRAQELALAAADRVIRKETLVVGKNAWKLEGDPPTFEVWADQFFGAHGAYVAEIMQVSPGVGAAWAAARREDLRDNGLEATADWPAGASRLAEISLALEEDRYEV